jgi:hypothetical protein
MAAPNSAIRRFQFSLRTFLIGVTLLAVALAVSLGWWCISEVRIAQERMALLGTLYAHGGEYQLLLDAEPPPMSFIRRWAGDRPIIVIWLPKPPDGLDVERIRKAFPEAQFLETNAGDHVATHLGAESSASSLR